MNMKNNQIFTAALALSLVAMVSGAGAQERHRGVKASAEMYDCNDGKFLGLAIMKEAPSSEGVKTVKISMRVKGLPRGAHAVHIHESGECVPCGAAGGHFDPGPAGFTSPDGNHPFHSGDLINLDVNRNAVGHMHAVTSRITLSPGPLSVFDGDGSAFIVHVDPDTYCPDGELAGCAGGARAACGVIQMD